MKKYVKDGMKEMTDEGFKDNGNVSGMYCEGK